MFEELNKLDLTETTYTQMYERYQGVVNQIDNSEIEDAEKVVLLVGALAGVVGTIMKKFADDERAVVESLKDAA